VSPSKTKGDTVNTVLDQVLDEPLLPPEDAARHIKVKPQTMAAWRYRGVGPSYVRVGKLIFYTPSALREYVAGRVVRPQGAR